LLASILFVVSCGGSAQKPVVAPVATDSAWIPRFLGGPADFTAMLRPNAVRYDTYWGPLVGRMLADTSHESDASQRMAAQQLSQARQIDTYVTLRDPLRLYGGSKGDISANSVGWVTIIYGMPPSDPVAFHAKHGQPLFLPPVRLPSGVLMFNAEPKLAADSAGLTPTLFFTTDGAWIAADQVSALRVRDFLLRTPTAPPQLSSTADGLAGITMGVTSMKFMNPKDAGAMAAGVVAAGIGLRGGSSGALEGYADYDTKEDAERAYKSFQTECAAKPNDCIIKPGFFKEARAERDDRRVLVTFAFSDALLRSIQSYSP
jgi:hypothetical protein